MNTCRRTLAQWTVVVAIVVNASGLIAQVPAHAISELNKAVPVPQPPPVEGTNPKMIRNLQAPTIAGPKGTYSFALTWLAPANQPWQWWTFAALPGGGICRMDPDYITLLNAQPGRKIVSGPALLAYTSGSTVDWTFAGPPYEVKVSCLCNNAVTVSVAGWANNPRNAGNMNQSATVSSVIPASNPATKCKP
jgi:hypothetical protein